jgi:hypothetical protein
MRIYLVAILSVYFWCFTASTTAQIPAAKNARAFPTEVENSENRVSQIISTAEAHFNQGKDRLKLNQREKAREEFDRAIDSIIESGFDVRDNERLETFYLELIERIYREEVPLRKLVGNDGPKNVAGFHDQSFVANRNDELSKPISSQATDSDGFESRRREYLSSIEEYKASLEKLLGIYERNLRQAEERFASAKQLYSNGLILRTHLNDAARSLNVERDKVVSTRKLISNVDAQVAMELLESKQQKKRPTSAGPVPTQLANGQIPVVVRYLNDNLHDPYSMKLLKWSKPRIVYKYDQPFWYVTLRMRAKNGFGAYILREVGFYLKNNKVVFTDNL